MLLTLNRGLRALEAVALSDGPTPARALGRKLSINLSSCCHLLRTLHSADYMVRLPHGNYGVGPLAGWLSQNVQQRTGLPPELSKLLSLLRRKTHQTSYLNRPGSGGGSIPCKD
ncbi:hypothetical protein [Streptomyces violaceusniger]|uniref:hypothetical protein n=1 Tax=Streptomyces violaceusniger TaxID=68280 RepID=UPI00382C3445